MKDKHNGRRRSRRPEAPAADPTLFQRLLQSPWMWLMVMAATTVIAYAPGFRGVFLFDDSREILENQALHTLSWPWNFALNVRRPFLYLTLALNYALGGEDPLSYHILNVAVHLAAGVTLFFLVRRTLHLLPQSEAAWRCNAGVFSGVVALLWLLHPLQTQAVTYIIQRAESMAALFYLLTLYSAVRWMQSRGTGWLAAAWLAALAGGLTKEVAVTAPAAVLLYDRAYVSASFQNAWRSHRKLYLGFLPALAVMMFLLAVARPEVDPTAGFGYTGISPRQYALNQAAVVWHYLRLSVWPSPLVFDYQWPAAGLGESLPAVLAMSVLLAATAVVYGRRPRWGFPAVFIFLVLIPSSGFIPLKDLAFEYRMYLSLAGVLVLLAAAASAAVPRILTEPGARNGTLAVIVVGLALVCGTMTWQRNEDYRDAVRMWADTVRKVPNNARARNNLGELYLRRGDVRPARRLFEQAVALDPEYADAHLNMSSTLAQMGDLIGAVQSSREAIRLRPGNGIAYNNLGAALSQLERYAEASGVLEEALNRGFREPGVYQNLGIAYARTGRPAAAIRAFETVLELDPDAAEARSYLQEVRANFSQGRPGEPVP